MAAHGRPWLAFEFRSRGLVNMGPSRLSALHARAYTFFFLQAKLVKPSRFSLLQYNGKYNVYEVAVGQALGNLDTRRARLLHDEVSNEPSKASSIARRGQEPRAQQARQHICTARWSCSLRARGAALVFQNQSRTKLLALTRQGSGLRAKDASWRL